MAKKNLLLNNIALFIALLFHTAGIIGILFTQYKDWFIQNTPVNLLLMAALLILTQPQKNWQFFLFMFVTFATGILTEIIGTNTSLLFGNYTYGTVLGTKIFGVPLIIGINWFIVIYCTGVVTQFYENRMLKRIDAKGITINMRMQVISFVTDAALLTVFFDWLMEPVAMKLGYWKWENDNIPFYNYLCWLMISALLLALFRRLGFRRHNIFAVHLFIIQLLFFLVLRTFL
jgi:putative membrane protein